MKMQVPTILSCLFVLGTFAGCALHKEAVQLPPLTAAAGRIAYINHMANRISTRAGTVVGALYVISADGLNPHPVMKSYCTAAEPAWSHDGTRIAFAGSLKRPGRTTFIYVVNADGTDLHPITTEHASLDGPAWSPDDKEIAYQCWDTGSTHWSIHIIGADGKNDRKIGSSTHTETYPYWFPDGKRLLFHTQEQGYDWDIAVMNADGSDAHKLTQGPETDWVPVCSPDGSKIAFWSSRTGGWEIFIMNADGTGIKQLTHEEKRTGLDISRPAWSPDGKYIAYVSCRSQPRKMDILLIDMQGRERCLTTDSAHHVAPSWTAAAKSDSNM